MFKRKIKRLLMISKTSKIVDGENDLSDVVMIDESIDVSDFITLSDDTIMLSDADMLDTYSTDIDGSDISFIL